MIGYRVANPQQYSFDTPSTTWVVNHTIGGYPIVDCLVNISGTFTKMLPASVTYNTPSQCTIVFSTAQSGYVVLT